MYGLRHDGLAVDGLSPGVNIIHGPNASGKSTLARALQALCWPELLRDARAELNGRFVLEGAAWQAHFDTGHVAYQRDGVEAAPPRLAPPDQRDRYYLALHDLLHATNERLAQAILEAAAGGYNVEAARDALGFRRARPRHNRTAKTLQAARRTLQAARQQEEDVWAHRREIEALQAQRQAAREAEARLGALEQVQVVQAQQRTVHEARQAVQAFPAAMAQLEGGEQEALEQRRTEEQTLASTLEDARRKRAAAASQRAASSLPADGLPEGTLTTLSKQVDALAEAEAQVDRAEAAVRGARAKRAEEWARIEGALDEDHARAIDVEAINDVAQWAREAETVRARRTMLADLERMLVDADEDETPDDLEEGIRLLRQWLGAQAAGASTGRARKAPYLVVTGSVLAALAAIGLGLFVHPIGWALLGVAALLLVAYGMATRGASSADDASVYRRDFERLQLPGPDRWAEEPVQARLRALEKVYDTARLQAIKQNAWTQYAATKQDVEAEAQRIEARRDALADRLGIAPAVDEAPLEEPSLYYLVESLRRWQDAAAEVERHRGEREAARAQRDDRRAAVNEVLAGYGFEPVADSGEARGRVEALREEDATLKEAQQEHRHAEETLDRATARQQQIERDIDALFEELGLAPGDDAGLARLVDQHDAYRAATRALDTAEIELDAEERRLRKHPAYEEGMLEMDNRDVTAEIDRLRAQADRIDDLTEQITRMQERIDQAMQQHDVEDAQAAYDRAVQALEEEYTADVRATAGWHLANYVHERTRDQELPDVFHRARKLFLKITQGRYRLAFDHAPASFAAYDTQKEQRMRLDELSSGTRVQLLLAVRVAFVAGQEQGAALPLILDETLANSDDEKAQAIIQAVQEISAEGRQVFYLTAQNDEVAKWKALQHGSDVEHRFIALNGAPEPPPRHEPITVPSTPTPDALPDPAGMTHAAYGDALAVPPWTPRMPLGALHLWYLVEDVAALHRVLAAGIPSWGPFEALAQAGGELVDWTKRDVEQTAAYAEAVRAWKEAWLTGRGREVDRAALEASGAVSDTFMERVAALSAACRGDGAAIIEGLRNGAVKRFHESKTDELEAYFEREGYIDPAPLLTEEAIQARILSGVSEALERGLIRPEGVWALFDRIEQRARGAIDAAPSAP